MNNLIIKFTVNAKPISKSNEKIMNKSGRYFTSQRYKAFEFMVGMMAKQALPKGFKIFEQNGLSVKIDCYFNSRKCIDCANIPKSITDAIQNIVYKNDNQIDKLIVMRTFDKLCQPHFIVEISD